MRTGKLTAKKIESIIAGRDGAAKRYYGDGGGLWLVVSKRDDDGKPQAASWVYRYMLRGRNHEMGLGSVWDVRLADAREAARVARQQVKTRKADVLAERKEAERQQRDRARIETARRMTFKECAEALIAAKESGWRNATHRQQWTSTLKNYAFPIIGDLSVAQVDTALVIKIVEPLWRTKTETASRLRGRIEAVLDWAKVRGYRDGENPAKWRGHLEHLLPKKSKLAPVKHHEALPYRDIGTFVAEIREQKGVAARALEFLILNWSRTGEVIGARWDEINVAERLWIIPRERMKKTDKEHRVPLSRRSLEIIAEMAKVRERRPSAFVFQGIKDGEPLSNMAMLMLLRRLGQPELTCHGLRSTARDWAAEMTGFPNEMCELQLSHTVPSKVEAAYRRGTMFEKRRDLTESWSRYCDTQPVQNGKVVAIGAA